MMKYKKKLVGLLMAILAIIFVALAVAELFYGLALMLITGWAFLDASQISDWVTTILVTISLVSYPFVVVAAVFLADKAFKKDKLMPAVYFSLLPLVNICVLYVITHFY